MYSTPTSLKKKKWPTSACHSPDASCRWLGGILLGELFLGGLLLVELLLGGLLLSELLLHEPLLGGLRLDKRLLSGLPARFPDNPSLSLTLVALSMVSTSWQKHAAIICP